jgi:integrase
MVPTYMSARPRTSPRASRQRGGFRDAFREGRSGATVNRFPDLLSAMFKRAKRLGLVDHNSVVGVQKYREPSGRIVYILEAEERALVEFLPVQLKPHVTIALHTGLRWSEQARLAWRDVDLMADAVQITDTKNSGARIVPLNAAARAAFMELAMSWITTDPGERVFAIDYTTCGTLFRAAVVRAQAALVLEGKSGARLEGFTWHGCRHTFASRLAMAGVDLVTIQRLGGWKTLAMVARYAHLSPAHARAAVERTGGRVESEATPKLPRSRRGDAVAVS